VFDDASMWISAPMSHGGTPDDLPAAWKTKTIRKHEKSGRMVFAPVLNNEQVIIASRAVAGDQDNLSVASAVQVHTPAVVLPEANHSTVRNRLEDWSVLSALQCSQPRPVDPDSTLKECSPDCWQQCVMVKDCLMVNNNIVAGFERRFEAERNVASQISETAEDNVPDVFHMNCQGHSVTLCSKPIALAITGLPTFVVRMGHLCQSHRPFAKIMKSMNTIFDKNFRYRRVLEKPLDYDRWVARAREVLEMSRVACDLTDELIELILAFLNSDWDGDLLIHFCLPGCKCGGIESAAKAGCQRAVYTALGGGCCLALLYRWKNIERGCAWLWRGRKMYDLIGRSCLLAFDPEAVKKAEAELLQAAAQGDDSAGAKNTVKGGQVNY